MTEKLKLNDKRVQTADFLTNADPNAPKMRAGFWDGPYSQTVTDVPIPPVGPNDVKLRIAYCGICENDIFISSGALAEIQPPSILGHEFSGVIVEVGEKVTECKVGDRVACNMQVFCGKCWACKNGYEHYCKNVVNATGAFADYVVVDEKAVEHVPDDMTLLHASFLELVSASIYSVETAEVIMGRSLCVLGSGTKAQFEALIGRMKGANPVIFVSSSKVNRDKALELGADYAFDPETQDVKAEILKVTDGRGADRVIESAGTPESCTLATEIAAKCATINFAFNYAPGTKATFDMELLRYGKQLRLHTSIQSPYLFNRTMQFLPRVPVEKLVTAIRPLEELNDAFLQQRDHEEFKIVIEMAGENA